MALSAAERMRNYRARKKAREAVTLGQSELPIVHDPEPLETERGGGSRAVDDDDIAALAEWSRSTLSIPPGHPLSGRPLVLPPFAVDFLAHAVRHRIAYLSVARKNAKSSIISVYLLAKLVPDSPIYQRGFRCGVVSLTEKHSREVFTQISDLALAANLHTGMHFRTSSPRRVEGTAGTCEFLSADRASGHSSGFDVALIDEIGLMQERDRALISAMRTSTLARNGKLWAISVYGRSPFSREIAKAAQADSQVYFKRYAAPDDCALDDEAAIRAANPAVAAGILQMSTLLSEARYAKQVRSEEQDFRALVLNQSVFGGTETLLSMAEFQTCMKGKLPPRKGPYYLGLDRGESDSLSAAVGYWPESRRCEYLALVGGSMTLQERSERDNIDYPGAVESGELVHDDGAAVPDFETFLAGVVGEWGKPKQTVLDSYRKQDTREVLRSVGIREKTIEWRRSGPISSDPDVRATRRLARLGQIALLAPAILMAENVQGTKLDRDRRGNLSVDKASRNFRIDLCSALILAVGAADRSPPARPLQSFGV